MNFSELKQKFPVSFKLFEAWVEKNHETRLNIWNGTIRNEDVVCWLDENKMNIQVSVKVDTKDNIWYLPYVWDSSDQTNEDVYADEDPSRKVSTSNVITKAFELLEAKLKIN